MEKCSFCGFEFELSESKLGCKGCPMGASCGKIKCPKCNYEMPVKPEIPKIIKKMKGLILSKNK